VARPREFDETDAIRVAGETFWRHGYQATSIKELEEATGLTAGSLYKAYGSKRKLFERCLDQYMKEHSYLAILLRTFETPLKPSLQGVFDMIIDSAKDKSPRPAGCLVTNHVAELMNVDPPLGANAAHALGEMQKALKFRLRWAQEKGDLKSSCDIGGLAAYLMVVIQGMLVLSTSTKDVVAMKQARDIAIAALDCA